MFKEFSRFFYDFRSQRDNVRFARAVAASGAAADPLAKKIVKDLQNSLIDHTRPTTTLFLFVNTLC
jgi:hypothetical protein